MATKLYVGNLSFRTTSEELREAFAAVGTVESASVIEDRETGRSRGFAFVEMATPEEAAAAIEAFNGKDFGGRNLTVNEAKPRTDRGGGGRGGYGGGRGGGRGGDGGGRDRRARWGAGVVWVGGRARVGVVTALPVHAIPIVTRASHAGNSQRPRIH